MTLHFERIDAKHNRFRVYRIAVCRDLFGAPCVVTEWGRRGRRLRFRSEVFTSDGECERRAAFLALRRRQRGYSLVTSQDHRELPRGGASTGAEARNAGVQGATL
jgi:predicted DNA-binding WGR domain protein